MAAELRRVKLGEIADVSWGDTTTTKASYVPVGVQAFSATGPDGYLPIAQFDRTGVVVSAIGAQAGKTWLARGRWSTIKNTLRFWSIDPEVDTEYLYWLTRDSNFWPKRGSAQPFISQGDARNLVIALPPLAEQRRIAHILGTLDDKIELNRRMNETLEEMARALFKSWFVDFDPVRAKAEGRDPGLPKHLAGLFPDRLVDSELGEIPEGWTVGRLGDIADQVRRALRPAEIAPGTPYIGLEHMPRRSISLDTWGIADAVASGKSGFCEGEVLFGKLRPYFHKVAIASFDGVCSTDIVVLRAKQSEWAEFVLHLVSSDDFVAYTDARSAGTKMPRTSWSDMAQYRIARPTATVIERFAGIVGCLPARFGLASHEARALGDIRNTLLRRLLDSHNSVGA